MNWDDAIKAAIWAELVNIHTALPGRIEKYEYSTKKADVKPLIKKRFRDGTVKPLPVITDVPVLFPGSADTSITFPLKKGDPVLLIFAERSLERWLSDGGDVEPGDPRKFDLTDAIAIPGLFSFKAQSKADNNSDLLVVHKQSEIRITGQNVLTMKNNTGSIKLDNTGKLAMGNSTAELLQQISTALQAIATSNCANGAPLSNAAQITAAQQLIENALRGSL